MPLPASTPTDVTIARGADTAWGRRQLNWLTITTGFPRDIHKLDAFYGCFVPAQSHPPTIRAKVALAPSFARSSTSSR